VADRGGFEVHEMTLTKEFEDRREIFVDYMADGSYDLHMYVNRETGVGRNRVFLQGAWQDVEGRKEVHDSYHNVLANRDEVRFDPKTRQWALVND